MWQGADPRAPLKSVGLSCMYHRQPERSARDAGATNKDANCVLNSSSKPQRPPKPRGDASPIVRTADEKTHFILRVKEPFSEQSSLKPRENMAKTHTKTVSTAIEKRTVVMPRRPKNTYLRSREYLTDHEMQRDYGLGGSLWGERHEF